MAAPQWVRDPIDPSKPKKWAGGRLKLVGGRELFVIERQVGPTKFSITLDTTDPDEALAELALFNRAPASYRSPAKVRAEAVERASMLTGVVWTDTLVDDFIRVCQARAKRGELSDRYVRYTLDFYLGEWTKALAGRDLRSLRLVDLRAALKRWKGVAEDKRITALKAFTAWLRQEGKLDRSEDPTLDLVVPQAQASKDVRDRSYPIPLVEALYREITLQPVRDAVLLRAKTGMHHTEIQRLRTAELRELNDPSGIHGMIVFFHAKKDAEHAVSVDAQTFAAAQRMAKGAPDHKTTWKHLNLALAEVAKSQPELRRQLRAARVQPEMLRHSFSTWARKFGTEVKPASQTGVPLAKVSETMGHTSKRTTAKHYLGDHVREMIRIPISLSHPDDPAIAPPSPLQTERPSAPPSRGASAAATG